jgi:hypothetical protein
VDVDTKYEITFDESAAYEDACQMNAPIKAHLKEVKNADTESVDTDLDKPQKTQVTDRRGNTEDAELLAYNTYRQAMYETYQEEDVNKTYPEKTTAPINITNDDPLHNGVPRQTGTEDVARKPAGPDAVSEKGELDVPNVDVPDVQDVPNVDVPDVQDVPNVDVPDVQDVPDMNVVPNVQNVPDVQDVPNVQDSIDVPGTAAHNIFNTNSWQTSPRPRRSPCLPPSRERGGPGA